MGNKLRHEGDEVRIKVIWPDEYNHVLQPRFRFSYTSHIHLNLWLKTIYIYSYRRIRCNYTFSFYI